MKKHASKFHFYDDKDVKLPEEPKDTEACMELENYSSTELNNEDLNLPSYEEMMISKPSEEIGDLKTTTESRKNTIDTDTYCNVCSKQFKTKNNYLRHMSRIHSKISEYEQKCLAQDVINGLKDEYDINILEIANTLNRNTGYIRKNAENILDLLTTQNCHNSQIKKSGFFCFQAVPPSQKQKCSVVRYVINHFQLKAVYMLIKVAITKDPKTEILNVKNVMILLRTKQIQQYTTIDSIELHFKKRQF